MRGLATVRAFTKGKLIVIPREDVKGKNISKKIKVLIGTDAQEKFESSSSWNID